MATKARCQHCRAQQLHQLSETTQEGRQIVSWCEACSHFTSLVLDEADYQLPMLSPLIRLPPQITQRLRGEISKEDLLARISSLPARKAPGPDQITHEMLKAAPEALLDIIRAALNKALTSYERLPIGFKEGLGFMLYKKGSMEDPANFRAIILLNTIYKMYTSVVTFRLNAILEEHGILDLRQEGFRQRRSTGRQIQSVMWEREQARDKRAKLIQAFIDFCNAFNSIDHPAVWSLGTYINLPDLDLLQNIYEGTYYQTSTPYGITARIVLTRGTKQGDGLSPLLFIFLFNALLVMLKRRGVDNAERVALLVARAFADDLTISTDNVPDAEAALNVIKEFCEWSGTKVNWGKSEITAYDFRAEQPLTEC